MKCQVSFSLNKKKAKVFIMSSAAVMIGALRVVVLLLFYVHGKHLRSCQDGQLT